MHLTSFHKSDNDDNDDDDNFWDIPHNGVSLFTIELMCFFGSVMPA